MAAMRWASQHDIDICNLSLGTVREHYAGPMRALTDEVSERGMVLVAAANDGGTRSYPAACPSVISVGCHAVPDPGSCWPDPTGVVDFLAWGTGVPVWTTGGTRVVSRGSSLAAAHMSGIIANLLSITPGLKPGQLKRLLLASHSSSVGCTQSVPLLAPVEGVQTTLPPTLSLNPSQHCE
jgi:subtilisin family serine protease